MSFFDKLLDGFMLSRASPEQLVEVLLPGWIPHNKDTRRALERSHRADRVLMQMPPASIKRGLISGMRSPDPYVRDACGHRLSNIVDDDVAEVMLDSLADENSWVRTHAACFFAYNMNPAHLSNREAMARGLREATERETDEKRKSLLEEALRRYV